MAANHYKPVELFRRLLLQNAEKKNSLSEENTEEVDGAMDNLLKRLIIKLICWIKLKSCPKQ